MRPTLPLRAVLRRASMVAAAVAALTSVACGSESVTGCDEVLRSYDNATFINYYDDEARDLGFRGQDLLALGSDQELRAAVVGYCQSSPDHTAEDAIVDVALRNGVALPDGVSQASSQASSQTSPDDPGAVSLLPALLLLAAAAGVLGMLPAYIASRKGRNAVGWWVLGTLFFVPALIGAAVISPPAGAFAPARRARRCPFCDEEVRDAAVVCKHCGHDIVRPAGTGGRAPAATSGGESSEESTVRRWLLAHAPEGATISQIAEGAGVPRATVRVALREIQGAGRGGWVDTSRFRAE